MKAPKRYVLIAAALLFATVLFKINTESALAKGPFGRVTLSGGKIEGAIEISDPLLMDFFSLSNFPNAGIEQPLVEGDGYLVTRYFLENDGSLTAWDSLRFYPNITDSGGYIFYEGLVNGSSEYDGKWYLASYSGSSRLRRVITASEQPLIPMKTILIHFLYITAALAGIGIIVVIGLTVIHPSQYQTKEMPGL